MDGGQRIFVTRWFARFARRERIADASLVEAVRRAIEGMIDADLGGGVLKQRIARSGKGRSGGYRILLAWRPRSRAVFLYGFAKNDRANINDDELATLRDLARAWLAADATRIERALGAGEIEEVDHEADQET